jgi:hypothetical protein
VSDYVDPFDIPMPPGSLTKASIGLGNVDNTSDDGPTAEGLLARLLTEPDWVELDENYLVIDGNIGLSEAEHALLTRLARLGAAAEARDA